MIEAIGDLWTYTADARGIPTNGAVTRYGRLVMGAGVALQARQQFLGIDLKLGKIVQERGNHCHMIRWGLYTVLFTFPTKDHWKDPASLDLIARSCEEASALADKHGWLTVALPRVGSGHGGLEYSTVRPVLAERLDDRFHILALR